MVKAKIGETNVLVDAHVLVDKLCRLKMMTSKNFQASQRSEYSLTSILWIFVDFGDR